MKSLPRNLIVVTFAVCLVFVFCFVLLMQSAQPVAAGTPNTQGIRQQPAAIGDFAADVVIIGVRPGSVMASVSQLDMADGFVAQLQRGAPDIRVEGVKTLFPPDYVLASDAGVDDSQVLLSQIYRLHLEPGQDVLLVAQQLSTLPGVAFAEPDYRARLIGLPDDPRFPDQWPLSTIGALGAWGVMTGTSDVTVAVIDSGIDLAHPDLAGKLWVNPGEIPGNLYDDDNNGAIDDINGWNFVGQNGDLSDATSHGTEVAGIIGAATNNGIGIAGVCWQCRLMVVKVVGSGGVANYSDIAQGIVYAVDKGADVINISLGGATDSTMLRSVIDAASAQSVIVAGAGNDATDAPFYPAAYEGVLAVAGIQADGTKVATSNYGAWVDVAAPGAEILSTIAGGGYALTSGTSMASPFASGLAGLLRSAHPDWPPELLRAQIIETAESVDALNPAYAGGLGAGRIAAGVALTMTPGLRFAASSFAVDGIQGKSPEPGKTFDLDVELVNRWVDASSITARLRSSDPKVTIVSGDASYGALTTFEKKFGATPFRVALASDVPYLSDITFTLDVTQGGVVVAAVPFRVQTASQVVQVGGFITSDTNWTSDRSYRVTGHVIVNDGVTLTVAPGTVVKVDPGKTIRILGTLDARGTAEAPITFTSNAPNPQPGNWDTIEVKGKATFHHVRIEYAGFGVASLGGNLELRNSIIRNVGLVQTNYRCTDWGSGVCIELGTAIIEDNTICNVRGQGSNSGSGVIVSIFGIGSIRNNIICDNNRTASPDMHDNGGGIKIQSGAGMTISNNLLTGNGIGLYVRGNTSALIQAHNNAIFSNVLYDAAASFSVSIDATNNYWATSDPQAIADRVYDIFDDINSGQITYIPFETSVPDGLPPFLADLRVLPGDVVGIEPMTLLLTFTHDMDQSMNPAVAFGSTEPYTSYVVVDDAGWIGNRIWRGSFDVTSLVPRGLYTVSVSGAVSAVGTELPPDRRFSLVVDYASQIADTSAPAIVSLSASGMITDVSAVTAAWSAVDGETEIIEYRYRIGSAPGASDIIAWTPVMGSQVVRTGLGLVQDRQYWIGVQARNAGGLWSAESSMSFVAGQEKEPAGLFLPVIRR